MLYGVTVWLRTTSVAQRFAVLRTRSLPSRKPCERVTTFVLCSSTNVFRPAFGQVISVIAPHSCTAWQWPPARRPLPVRARGGDDQGQAAAKQYSFIFLTYPHAKTFVLFVPPPTARYLCFVFLPRFLSIPAAFRVFVQIQPVINWRRFTGTPYA